jgi:hypothetical protein
MAASGFRESGGGMVWDGMRYKGEVAYRSALDEFAFFLLFS